MIQKTFDILPAFPRPVPGSLGSQQFQSRKITIAAKKSTSQESTMTNVLRAKLLVIGDSAVGKSSIVQQFLNSGAAFPKNYSMTLSADIVTRTINIPESLDTVELIIVDCSGKAINNDIIIKVNRPYKIPSTITWDIFAAYRRLLHDFIRF